MVRSIKYVHSEGIGLGNWIHGTDRNPILDIARDVGATLLSPGDDRSSFYDEVGDLIEKAKAREHNKVVWSIIGDAFGISSRSSASIPQDKSLMDFFEEETKKKDLPQRSQQLVLHMARIWGDFIGDSIEKQSLKVSCVS